MYDFDSVWATHEFVIERLTENELLYNKSLSNMPELISRYESGDLEKEELLNYIDDAEKNCAHLDGLYKKHLLSIKEIELYIKDNQIPENMIAVVESLPELKTTTMELMETIKSSKNLLAFIRKEKT